MKRQPQLENHEAIFFNIIIIVLQTNISLNKCYFCSVELILRETIKDVFCWHLWYKLLEAFGWLYRYFLLILNR